MGLRSQSESMDIVLNELAKGRSIKEACQIADVSTHAHYHWLKTDEPYKKTFEIMVKPMRRDVFIGIAEDRIRNGVEENKITVSILPDGREIPVEKVVTRKFSDALLLRQLEALAPDEYGKKVKQEITNTTDIAAILAAARKRLGEDETKKSDA